jgi:predicted HTH domain antitoxin
MMQMEEVPMRCETCGIELGLTSYTPKARQAYKIQVATWCSPECAATLVSENEERDEVICELFLSGQTAIEVSREVDTSRQNIQQILNRRGVHPYRYYPNQQTPPRNERAAR